MKKFRALIIDFIIILIILISAIILVSFGGIGWKEVAIFWTIIYVINCIFICYITIKNDNTQEKMTWIFFLIVFPIIAHIIFALFRIRREIGISRQKYEEELNQFSFNKTLDTDINLENVSFLSPLEKEYFYLTKRHFYNTNLQMYFHGFEAYEALFQDLEKAQKFIHIEMYIIKPSEVFEKFKNILIKKAKEGVEIKIIVDDFGSWLIKQKEFDYLKEQGIEVLIFNKTTYPFVKPTDNNRLHRKFFIIDGKIVHSGGLNISDEYRSFNEYYGYWADLNFRVDGKVVNDYEAIFLYDWYKISEQKLDFNNYLLNKNDEQIKYTHLDSKILVFDEGPNNYDNLLEQSLLSWIYNSKEKIKIATPYFIPTKRLFVAFEHALKRGVDIEFYIPGKPDKRIVYKATKFYLKELVKQGAKVFKLENIFLHSKIAIYDDQFAFFGTNNLDMRSLFTNYEAINLIQGKENINKINFLFDEYKEKSITINIEKENKLVFECKKIVYLLFSPLM